MDIQPTYEYSTRVWGRTHSFYDTTRPTDQVKVAGNYYLEEALGGDHEFKFGFEYKKAATTSLSAYGDNTVAGYYMGEPYDAWLNPELTYVYEGTYYGFYIGDTFTRGKLTLNLGARYDSQRSVMPPAVGPAHPFAPEVLPEIDFPGLDPGWRWNNFSPRLGFTYDLTGDGKTILRGSFSRYASQMGNYMATQGSPIGYREVDFAWNDANGDGFVQNDELLGYPNNPTYWTGVDLDNPASVTSPNTWDENLSSPMTTEIIIGTEREVMPQLSVGVNFIYRRYTNEY